MTEENKIVKTEPQTLTQEFSIQLLISKALENSSPVETLERLLAMRDKLKAEWAKEQFIIAMGKFQAECPIIKKDRIVKGRDGKIRYKYAGMENIVSQVKEIITKNGLSYKFDEDKDDKFATAICVVTHSAGHSEPSSFKVEIGSEEFMTNVQKYGARMTFAKRYAFCNAFGITTMDEDTDAKGEEEKPSEENNLDEYKKKLQAAKNVDELSKVWSNLPAKAKGGLFTFKEELKKKYEVN